MHQEIAGRIIHGGCVSAIAVEGKSGQSLGGRIVVLDTLQPQPVLSSIVEGVTGVIARVGGVASHGAALLREAGVPTLTAVDFPDSWSGKRVTLDANVGVVRRTNDRS